MFYALSEVNRVITTALLSSAIITNIIINMRCVLPQDKAPALGLDATFTSLISYLPIKAIYGAIAGMKQVNKDLSTWQLSNFAC